MGTSLYVDFHEGENKQERRSLSVFSTDKLKVISSFLWGLCDTVVLGVACETEAITQH